MKRSGWTVLLLGSLALPGLVGCSKKENSGSSASEAAANKEVVAAGASDLVFAMDEIIPRFEKNHGAKVKFVAGSSGNLAAQLAEGAPYDVFFSANEKFVDDVVKSGVCDGATKAMYARGRIVLWAPEGAKLGSPEDLAGLTDERYRKIAIANPDHAPYGMAAKQAMEKAGLWDDLRPRLVYGQNIKSTMQLVETGNTEVGIIALSLAIKSPGTKTLLPEDLHANIDQYMVVCTGGSNADLGRTFAEYLGMAQIREVMASYGFVVPDGPR
jgi:molybdate transport system substrate-binding protein